MNRRLWHVAPYSKEKAIALSQECEADVFTSLLLSSRGVETADAIEDFLTDDCVLSDPYEIKDMDRAVRRIRAGVDAGEKICVYGDYDADGVTATALVFSYLEGCGADVITYIPSRTDEGYGLHNAAVDMLCAKGVKLIVTVDNGIGAIEVAQYIKQLGMELVITDHHRPSAELPDAAAVVDPHREDDTSPFKDYAGVGVAFKLLSALEDGFDEELLDSYADLVAVGTVADIVPLVGENRAIVIRGMKNINSYPRPGIAALLADSGVKPGGVTSSSVAYTLSPRINAAGRMASADEALELMLCEDEEKAAELAATLGKYNELRHESENRIMQEIDSLIAGDESLLYPRVLVFSGRDWHTGVIGIVASKIVERYGKPAVVISVSDGVGKGSSRSLQGFSIFDALSSASDCLEHFGGHHLAAGFGLAESLIPELSRRLNAYAAGQEDVVPVLNIDCKLMPANVGMSIINSLTLLEPFGAGNPQPVFGLFNMTVKAVKSIGAGKHIRLMLQRGETVLYAIKFGTSAEAFPYNTGDEVDLAVRIEKNEYMGEVKAGIFIKEIRPAGSEDEKLFASLGLYDKILRAEPLTQEETALACPDRQLIASVYRYVRASDSWKYDIEVLMYRMKLNASKACGVSAALSAMVETGVLSYSAEDGYRAVPGCSKVELSASRILKRLGYTG